MHYPKYVAEIIDRLEDNGFEAYIVGGSVRDMILGASPHDFDVTTSALPDETLKLFADMRTIPTGLKHGTVTVLSDGEPIEITTFRIDGDYKDSRRPETVSFTRNIRDDLARRDFTVNAMAYNESRGIIDYFDGAGDLKKKIIRAVGDPKKRFSEDALRIMRAFRFSAQLGFEIDDKTLFAAAELNERLENIARERIANEFLRLICSSSPLEALRKMRDTGTLRFILCDYSPSDRLFEALSEAPSKERIRLGIIMSECPKERTRELLAGLKLSGKLTSNTITLASVLSGTLSGDGAAARRFIGACGELAADAVCAAKALGKTDAEFEALVKRNLSEKVCTTNAELAVNGSDIVKLGIKGKKIGETLSYLLERVIEEPQNNTRERLLLLAEEYNKKEE
ncbi:MAG: CCA tRNA nucleotidyltransferase [Clostridia bacterium]|nr:CCA tRNA nucleotidyltransferase [Clostridia bacterium]